MPIDSSTILKNEILAQVRLGTMSPDEAAETIRVINAGGQKPTEMPVGGPGKVWIYSRVSTKDQADNGISIEEQERQARAYFDFLKTMNADLVWGGVFAELGVSAFKNELIFRPVGRVMHSRLKRGDQIIFVRLDRGFRNLKDFLTTWAIWQHKGVNVHFLDLRIDLSTANGRFFAQVVSAIAEWESATKSESLRRIKAWLREQGKPTNQSAGIGKKLIGSGKNKRTAPDFHALAVMRLIVRIRDREGLSWRQVSDRIEAIFAKREGRKMIREGFGSRQWGWFRCQKAYKLWKERQAQAVTHHPDRVAQSGSAESVILT